MSQKVMGFAAAAVDIVRDVGFALCETDLGPILARLMRVDEYPNARNAC